MNFWKPPRFYWPFVFCIGCRRIRRVRWRHTNTNYVDDKSNWVKTCLPCFEDIEAYWAERWAEYRSGAL